MPDRFTVAVAAVVVIALAAAVVVLAWHGTINGQAAIGYLSTLTIGGVIGGGVGFGIRSGAAAQERALSLLQAPPPEFVNDAVHANPRKARASE